MEEKYYQLLTSCGTFTDEGEEAFSFIFEEPREGYEDPIYIIRELHNLRDSGRGAYISFNGDEDIELPKGREEIVSTLAENVNTIQRKSIFTIFLKENCGDGKNFHGINVGAACRNNESGRLMLLPKLNQVKGFKETPKPINPETPSF